MSEGNSVKMPLNSHVKLTNPTERCDLNVPYREAVGSRLFLAMVSRPDIAFAVGVVSRYLNNYDESHWQTIKRIFLCFNATSNFGFLFQSKTKLMH